MAFFTIPNALEDSAQLLGHYGVLPPPAIESAWPSLIAPKLPSSLLSQRLSNNLDNVGGIVAGNPTSVTLININAGITVG